MKRVRLDTSYQAADGDIRLTVIIGNAQIGVSNVKLNEKVLATGDIIQKSIGMGPNLVGQQLIVKTVVTDVNDSTNRTNVKYLLSGGRTDQEFDLNATVDEDGDSVVYLAIFEFTN